MSITASLLCDLVALVLLVGFSLVILASQSFEKSLNHFSLFFVCCNFVLFIFSIFGLTTTANICAHISSLLFLIVMLYYLFRTRGMLNPYEIPVLIYIPTIVIVANIVSLFIEPPSRSSIILSASVVAGFISYIYTYAEIFKRDKLTGLLTRRTLYADLSTLTNQNVAIISCDLNDLKGINDSGGHEAGDRALRTLANICLASSKRAFRVYRVGGDEYIIIGPNRTEDEANEFIKLAKSKLASTPYSASFGRATYSPEQNIDDVLNRADRRMYRDKNDFHFRTSPRKR